MNILWPGLCGDDPLSSIRLLEGVFLANHLASTDNLDLMLIVNTVLYFLLLHD